MGRWVRWGRQQGSIGILPVGRVAAVATAQRREQRETLAKTMCEAELFSGGRYDRAYPSSARPRLTAIPPAPGSEAGSEASLMSRFGAESQGEP